MRTLSAEVMQPLQAKQSSSVIFAFSSFCFPPSCKHEVNEFNVNAHATPIFYVKVMFGLDTNLVDLDITAIIFYLNFGHRFTEFFFYFHRFDAFLKNRNHTCKHNYKILIFDYLL